MDKICNYSNLMHWKNKSNFQKMLFSYENNILFSNIFFIESYGFIFRLIEVFIMESAFT